MSKLVENRLEKWSLTGLTGAINGGEILKYIGTEVIYAKFTKNAENGGWDNNLQTTRIDYIGDYDPMTGTYKVKHTTKAGEVVETRIMSAGFEWGDPEEKETTSRLIPMSKHYEMMELTLYFERLRDSYFKNRGTIGLEQIKSLVESKSKDGLRNILWIAAVIDSDTDKGLRQGILTFRITEVFNLQRRAKSWSFNLRDEDGTFLPVQKFTQEEDGTWIAKDFSYGGEVIGDLKIIDIESPREEVTRDE